MLNAKVLVLNLSTVGVEVVKYLSFLNVQKIGIIDTQIVLSEDLVNSYIFSKDSKGKTKSSLLKKWIQENVPEVQCEILKESFQNFYQPLQDYDLLYVNDIYDIGLLKKIDQFCKEKEKKWINCGCIGSLGYCFFNFN